MSEHGKGRLGAWRAWAGVVVAAALVTAALPAPASAHYQASLKHIWRHMRTNADKRYLRLADVRTLRGQYSLIKENAGAAGELVSSSISFGLTLASAPTSHVIRSGDTPPAECPGTPAMPEALPGHLCVYEVYRGSLAGALAVQNAAAGLNNSSAFGTTIYVSSTAAGYVESRGTWAVTQP